MKAVLPQESGHSKAIGYHSGTQFDVLFRIKPNLTPDHDNWKFTHIFG